MRSGFLLTSALLLTACSQGGDEPKRTSELRIEVERYSSGECSFVTVRNADGREILRLDDRCRGWSVKDCNGALFFRTGGVAAEWGTLIPAGREVPVQLPPLIDSTLGGRSPPEEMVHLRFAGTRCTPNRFELDFEGSSIERGASGPASPLSGVVTLEAGGRVAVRFAAD